MAFLAPFFLLAMAAIALPIVIHLLQVHKPKTLSFSTLAFFSSLQKKTMRRLAIKRWLLLALRIGAIAMLALALMRPFVKPEAVFWDGGPVLYAILIENGESMGRIDANGPYIDQAKAAVAALIAEASPDDRFLLMPTFGPHTPTSALAPDLAAQMLNDMSVSPAANRSAERWAALSTATDAEASGNRAYFWITDARAVQTAPLDAPPREGLTVLRIGSQTVSNLQVTDIRVRNQLGGPGKPLFIEVDVRNSGQESVEAGFISLEQDQRLRAQFPIRLDTSATETILFEVIPSSEVFSGRILLEGDGYAPDNDIPLSYRIPTQRSVLLIGEAAPMRYLRGALESAAELSSVLNVRRLSVAEAAGASLEGIDAIVLHEVDAIPAALRERIAARVQAGAGVLLFPTMTADIESTNRMLSVLGAGAFGTLRGTTSIDRIVEGHPVIEGLFDNPDAQAIRAPMPELRAVWRYDPQGATSGAVILGTTTAEPLFTEHRFGQGVVLVASMGTDARWSTFPANPFFAPMMTRLVMHAVAVGSVIPRQLRVGQSLDLRLRLPSLDARIERDGVRFTPETTRLTTGETRVRYPAEEWTPGIYSLRSGSFQTDISVQPSVNDHDLRSMSSDAIEGRTGVSVVESMDAVFGREISLWFLFFGFLLLAAESLVSRFFTT